MKYSTTPVSANPPKVDGLIKSEKIKRPLGNSIVHGVYNLHMVPNSSPVATKCTLHNRLENLLKMILRERYKDHHP